MIVELPAQTHGEPDMSLIPVRRSCEAGEVCPTLIYDTDTGDALVQAADAALNVPSGEGVVRIPAHLVAPLLYGINPDTFSGKAPT
jgi:hypothetical protein